MEELNKRCSFGLLLFIGTEIMFFAGLLSAYWVLRSQILPWPPVNQPRYPVYLTAINTVILLLSAWTFFQAEKKLKLQKSGFVFWLASTLLAGTIFLLVQGYEWFKLIQFGLKVSSNIYGGIFYLIVGSHAVHVLVALIILSLVLLVSLKEQNEKRLLRVNIMRKYWLFVVLVWPVIYGSLYCV